MKRGGGGGVGLDYALLKNECLGVVFESRKLRACDDNGGLRSECGAEFQSKSQRLASALGRSPFYLVYTCPTIKILFTNHIASVGISTTKP